MLLNNSFECTDEPSSIRQHKNSNSRSSSQHIYLSYANDERLWRPPFFNILFICICTFVVVLCTYTNFSYTLFLICVRCVPLCKYAAASAAVWEILKPSFGHVKKAPHSEESIDYAAIEMKEEVNDYDEKVEEKKEEES